MRKKIFKEKKGIPFFAYNIVDALFELTYCWCDNDLKDDRYPSYHNWEKDCNKKDVPDIETIHNFLKQFLPKGVKEKIKEMEIEK